MCFDPSKLSGEICVVVDLVPYGVERRRENIAVLRISAIPELSGGGFQVEGFDAGNAMGSTIRTTRIGPHGKGLSMWVLIANAAYALSSVGFEEIQ
jgi:hypothetical protein